jgi:putative ABC transport system permease protein
MLSEALKLALQAIRRNPLRSFLTMLGIVIGVGAVIALVTIGNGTTAQVTAELSRLGGNLLFVRTGQFGQRAVGMDAKPFNSRDIDALRSELSGVRAVAPVAERTVTVVYGAQNRRTSVVGTDNGYLVTQDWTLQSGREYFESELRAGRAACIIGATVHDTLFGTADPLGRSIRIGNVSCEVIGLLAAKGESGMGMDQDDIVLMPLRAFHRRIAGNTDINTIYVSARDGVDTARLQAELERLLRDRRKITSGQDDDFAVRDMRQIVDTMASTTALLTGLLGAVAAVSLLVGGIGVMNIMLVSVTERTREIGIRLAIGALSGQVLLQFLVEAVVLSLFGGVIGVLVGLGLAWLAINALSVPFVVDPTIIVIAFAFSALVGVLFGYVPARRAAHLDPIDALRHE